MCLSDAFCPSQQFLYSLFPVYVCVCVCGIVKAILHWFVWGEAFYHSQQFCTPYSLFVCGIVKAILYVCLSGVFCPSQQFLCSLFPLCVV